MLLSASLLVTRKSAFQRWFGGARARRGERLTPKELHELIREGTKIGSLDGRVGEIATRAIAFGELSAAHVMVPRSRVVGVSRRASPDELRRVILEEGHTRMPIYEGTIDKVIGYVTARDLIAVLWEKELIVLEDVIRPAYFVPKATRAIDLLAEMKKRRLQLAIVVDETETMCGIVTLEDLVEELVGDIFSEHDDVPPERIHPEPDGTWTILGEATVRDVNRDLEIALPEGETWSTVAGLCLELAGRIPCVGESFTTPDGSSIEITEATPRHIVSIRLRRPVRASVR